MYISKGYNIRFLKFFELNIYADDRENGEYKNFVYVTLFGRLIVNVTYRTGECEGKRNYYAGSIVKYNLVKKFFIESWDWFKRKVLWLNCSDFAYRFWNRVGVFNRCSYYNGTHFDTSMSSGKFTENLCVGKRYEWSNKKGMEFYLDIDDEMKGLIQKEGKYYTFEEEKDNV